MNMFWHELRVYRKSTVIWSLSMVVLTVISLSMFPAISRDAADFQRILEGYPEGVRKAFGISIDSVSTFLGFYSYIFGYVLLCGAMQAMHLGLSILSKEMREKTADFLLTKPVTRTQIVSAKLAAAVVSLAVTSLVYVAAAAVSAAAVSEKPVDGKLFLMVSIPVFFVQLMFLALGLLLSVLLPGIKSVLSVSLTAVFGFFIIGMLGSAFDEEAVRYATPFRYYDAAYIIRHGAYEPIFLVMEGIIVIAAVAGAYWMYQKKDVHAV
ncbi:ABC transporter permease subunit [Ectobacillus ponti]|uniref:ABC transporter permease n=1 Tax=Ectobacillus ponti TaxID=2961894 RepID=A0AA42BRE9_9BACI|nr:ABC transporter permease subunit [Ectobacillus ponti]MCP8970331.1 ABC transporter permease [Ectobacillus ponti]